MALQPRTTLDEHPNQQNRKATSIRDMCTAAFVINENNYRIYAMNLTNCTIVDKSTSEYVFQKVTGLDNIYFEYNEQCYYLIPTKSAPGLTNFPEFYISDFINNHYDELFLATMQSYVQQSMYVLVQKFEDNHFYCLLNDLFAIQRYISYYVMYEILTKEWTTKQKSIITDWIKQENRTDVRNADSINDAIKNYVVDAHITTGVHANLTNEKLTDKQFRQLTAQAYKYRRTYDKWFGLQYVPWANSDSETSDIVYCDQEGNAVTDADYKSTDKDVYTEPWYECSGNRYPIRTIEPITPSIEYRQQQFEEAIKYLDMEGLVASRKFKYPGSFLLWFRRVTEMLCTDTVKSLVELMTKVENERYYCDDYLNTSIKALYDEINFIANCYSSIFDKSISTVTIYNCIQNTFEGTTLDQLKKYRTFYYKWINQKYRDNIWNETNGYYNTRTGIANSSQRKSVWQNVYEFVPDSFSFNNLYAIASFKYGYTSDMFRNGIKRVHSDLIIDTMDTDVIGTVYQDETRFYIEYTKSGTTKGSDIITRTIIDSQPTINFVFWMYLMEPVLQERTLITIEPFLPYRECTCFLCNDFQMLLGWFTVLNIRYSTTPQIEQKDILEAIHQGKTNNATFKNSAKCKYTDLLRIYELYAEVADDMINDGDTVVTTVLNLKSVQYQPTLASTTGYPLIFSYGEPPEEGYTTDRTDIPNLPNIFMAHGSNDYITFDGTPQKKLIWIEFKVGTTTYYIPILEMNWTIDYRRYLEFDLSPYIENISDLLESATENNKKEVKRQYEQFMVRITRIQKAIIEQFYQIGNVCCTALFDVNLSGNQYTVYKLESYLYDDLELFDKVYQKYKSVEEALNDFISTKLGRIKYIYNYNGDETDVKFNKMTFYRTNTQYTDALNLLYQHETKIFGEMPGIDHKIAYPYVDGIKGSSERYGFWNAFTDDCETISGIYENSITPTITPTIISDIRNYVTDPYDFSWIFASTADLVMSDRDLSTYTDLDTDYSTYTKYELTE